VPPKLFVLLTNPVLCQFFNAKCVIKKNNLNMWGEIPDEIHNRRIYSWESAEE